MDSTSQRFVIITGCSGGGKSTLLQALHQRGHRVVKEPGRRLIQSGKANPYKDLKGFAQAAVAMCIDDMEKEKQSSGWVFFDRGLIDAAATLAFAGGPPLSTTLNNTPTFHRRVVFAPPWRAIFRQDQERRHDFGAAKDEATRLASAYTELGYQLADLPKTSVDERVRWVISQLESDPSD
ncbi:MAG: AAA family ATPase [Pseudomonadota bacterium]